MGAPIPPGGCPDPIELERLAIGDPVSGAVVHHVRDCPACSQYMAGIRSREGFLREVAQVVDRARHEADPRGDGVTESFGPKQPGQPDNESQSETHGQVIGPYKLLELIGEGGFGSVFMAEQERPVRRRVALKIIKLGMDTRRVIARFEQERQALAMMDHPNIAKVLDAGATTSGRPYFVMELVRGESITKYCDKAKLTIRERLELFTAVCHAVQHAHTKGIIHRDIKPSNVLVSVANSAAIPKVIDFGIAKATAGPLTDKTLFTEHYQIIGTPEYMSPEQAETTAGDIDTRSDVYSLGVLLYELLTGVTPLDAAKLRSASPSEMQRIIREDDPPRPSTRLSTMNGQGSNVAAARNIHLSVLQSELRRELEWIPLKALRKDRNERYRSASELADDVNNYLMQRPLIAGPESAAYRVHKFVRRNKAGVAAAGLMAVVLVVASGVSLWFGLREAQRTAELQKVSDFQAQMLSQIDPTAAGVLLTRDVRAKFEAALAKRGVPVDELAGRVDEFSRQWQTINATDAARELIDRTLLKPAVHAIDERFKDQPIVDAQLRQTLATRYRELGLYDASLPLQADALATRRRLLGAEHPDTLVSISSMGALLHSMGRLTEADPYVREALATRRRVLGEQHEATVDSIEQLATLLSAKGMLEEAEPYYRDVVESRGRTLGAEHPQTLTSMNNLGSLLMARSKLSEAEPYYRDALEARRRILGTEHPETLTSLANLGLLLANQGKLSEAETYLREAVATRRRILGMEHPDTLVSINNLAVLLLDQDKLSEAEPYYREALETSRRTLGSEHPDTLISIANLGDLLQAQGKLAEAEPYLREALDVSRRTLGSEHPETLTSINNMGTLLYAHGKLSEAEPFFREALETSRRTLGEQHAHTLMLINQLGVLLRAQGRSSEAVALLAPTEAAARKVFSGGDVAQLASLLTILGNARADLREFAAAEANLLDAYRIMATDGDVGDENLRSHTRALARLYTAWDSAEPGKGYDVRAAEWNSREAETKSAESQPDASK